MSGLILVILVLVVVDLVFTVRLCKLQRGSVVGVKIPRGEAEVSFPAPPARAYEDVVAQAVGLDTDELLRAVQVVSDTAAEELDEEVPVVNQSDLQKIASMLKGVS